MKKIIHSRGFWIFAFSLIYLLAMDFWWWGNESMNGPLGIPFWVWYFIWLQLVFVSVFYYFNKYYWK